MVSTVLTLCMLQAWWAEDKLKSHKMFKDINILEFGDYIWNHHVKCIQNVWNVWNLVKKPDFLWKVKPWTYFLLYQFWMFFGWANSGMMVWFRGYGDLLSKRPPFSQTFSVTLNFQSICSSGTPTLKFCPKSSKLAQIGSKLAQDRKISNNFSSRFSTLLICLLFQFTLPLLCSCLMFLDGVLSCSLVLLYSTLYVVPCFLILLSKKVNFPLFYFLVL